MTVTDPQPVPAQIDAAEWPELSYRLGLTDGLPTFPPERRVVDALIAGSGLPGDHIVGTIPPRGRAGSITAIAANAAMAGCLPEHMPAIVAALDGMLEPRFNLAGVVSTTHPCWPLVIVSGRAVRDLDMATAESVFNGGGARANMVIGRAIRLVLWNLGGGYPRRPVQEIIGHPGRMAFCIAEEPDNTPWVPLHETRGVTAPAGAVTVLACEGPQIVNFWGITTVDNPAVGRQWLEMIADQMGGRGNSNTHTMGEILVVVTPAVARQIDQEGMTKADAQEFLWRTARRRLGDIRIAADGSPAIDASSAYEWWPESVDQTDPDAMVPVAWSPDAVHLVVAGADSIPAAAVCPSWGHLGGFAETRALPDRAAGVGTS